MAMEVCLRNLYIIAETRGERQMGNQGVQGNQRNQGIVGILGFMGFFGFPFSS
jgi:hypothetical protein